MCKAYENVERCKSCGLCIADCPKEAIEMTSELNAAGYKHIRVDREKCVGCGACYTVCPDGVFTVTEQAM